MKVRELMDRLDECNPDSHVIVPDPARGEEDPGGDGGAYAEPDVQETTTPVGVLVTIEPGEPA